MSKNNVKKHSKYLSIDEIDTKCKKKFKITSPRSLSVMKKLGVSNSELHFVTYFLLIIKIIILFIKFFK